MATSLFYFLLKPMLLTLASSKHFSNCCVLLVEYGLCSSPANSLSWFSPWELEHSSLAMAVKLHSLLLYTRYGWEHKKINAVYIHYGP